MKNLCLIYNYAQHYRTDIFKLIDGTSQCDFVFGDKMDDVKKMDYSVLSNFKKEVRNITFIRKPFYFQKGAVSLLKEKYTSFLILGDVRCISTWAILYLAKFTGKKIYLWSHGWYGKENRISTSLKRLFFSMADGTFLYGNHARNLMIKAGLKESKLHVIYNSLSYDAQLAVRKELKASPIFSDHFKNDFLNLIFIGRLTKVKNLDLLLDAVAILESQSFHVNLTFIGDGEMTLDLQKRTELLGLNHVWFYGPCFEENNLSNLIFNADLCVSPGNVGLTAMHSMVYGTPVLTHNKYAYQMPEFEAIEDGETGTFFEFENLFSLVNSIKRWFKTTPDRDLVRQKCYRIIDTKYNPHIQLETLLKYIN